MVSKAAKIKLGVFVTVGTFLLVLLVAVIAGDKLMQNRDTYYISFKNFSVNGLQKGSEVKYRGIGIGRVEDIALDKTDVTNIVITISVEENTPIKTDMTAQLIFMGITGQKQIELQGGSKNASSLKPESYIKSSLSTIDTITGKAETIVTKIEQLINNFNSLTDENNRENFAKILFETRLMVEQNRKNLNSIVTNIDSVALHLAKLSKHSANTLQKIDAIVNNGKVEKIVSDFEKISSQVASANLDELIINANSAVKAGKSAITHFDLTLLKSRKDILQMIDSMRETIDYLNEFARLISDDPRLLLREKQVLE